MAVQLSFQRQVSPEAIKRCFLFTAQISRADMFLVMTCMLPTPLSFCKSLASTSNGMRNLAFYPMILLSC